MFSYSVYKVDDEINEVTFNEWNYQPDMNRIAFHQLLHYVQDVNIIVSHLSDLESDFDDEVAVRRFIELSTTDQCLRYLFTEATILIDVLLDDDLWFQCTKLYGLIFGNEFDVLFLVEPHLSKQVELNH